MNFEAFFCFCLTSVFFICTRLFLFFFSLLKNNLRICASSKALGLLHLFEKPIYKGNCIFLEVPIVVTNQFLQMPLPQHGTKQSYPDKSYVFRGLAGGVKATEFTGTNLRLSPRLDCKKLSFAILCFQVFPFICLPLVSTKEMQNQKGTTALVEVRHVHDPYSTAGLLK